MNGKNQSGLKSPGHKARKRLLDVSEKLFAEKGFGDTSVRDITDKAHCNIAAINYYFGGKEDLYREVFFRRLNEMRDARIKAIQSILGDVNSPVTLEGLIYGFSKAFVGSAGGSEFTTLLLREMLAPNLPRGIFIEECILPVNKVLKEALCKVCPGLDDRSAELCIQSLLGQLYHTMRICHFRGKLAQDNLPIPDMSAAIDHIVQFTVAGIRTCMAGKASEKTFKEIITV